MPQGKIYAAVDTANSVWQLEPRSVRHAARERTTSTASTVSTHSSSYALVSDPDISSSFCRVTRGRRNVRRGGRERGIARALVAEPLVCGRDHLPRANATPYAAASPTFARGVTARSFAPEPHVIPRVPRVRCARTTRGALAHRAPREGGVGDLARAHHWPCAPGL